MGLREIDNFNKGVSNVATSILKNAPIMIFLKYNGYYILKFPVNPEEITKSIPSESEKVNIEGIGQVACPTTPALAKISINSFFWQDRDLIPSSLYVNWIEQWQKSKLPAKLVVTKLNYSMYVTCEDFSYTTKAGEETDIYFNLDLQEYRPYGVKKLNTSPAELSFFDKALQFGNELKSFHPILFNVPRPQRINNKIQISNPYTVKLNDTILTITKRATGGTANWKDLYNENKDVLSKNNYNDENPDFSLPVGTKLVMPKSWGIQTNSQRWEANV